MLEVPTVYNTKDADSYGSWYMDHVPEAAKTDNHMSLLVAGCG